MTLLERTYFVACRAAGGLLRAARYSKTRFIPQDAGSAVLKSRRAHAPLLVRMSGPLFALLDTGVRVLAQRDWAERERLIYRTIHGVSVTEDARGVLTLPQLRGVTLASLLEDPLLDEPARRHAIELAVIALAKFHRAGFTHGDAMAENVMIDLDAGVARWFDFENIHDERRIMAWRRADDLRALLTTTALRTATDALAEAVDVVLDAYADEGVTRQLASDFAPVLRRSLTFHLGQAALASSTHRAIARLLRERARG